jgi:pimeloyl-ACP methyl ester carboxylesterase
MITSFPAEIPMKQNGTAKQGTLLFLHANSYSADLYQPFLDPLYQDFEIWAPDLPGHGDSRWIGRIQDWNDLANYFIEHLEQNDRPKKLIGMGHSIGAILIIIMAIKRPRWFSKIILLDPVLLPKPIFWAIRVLRLFSLSHLIPLAKATKRRKQIFSSREQALEHYSKKVVFSRWKPQFLKQYVDTCLYPTADGHYQLSCAPQLESSIYQSIPANAWSLLKRLSTPALFIIGEHSDTVNQRGFRRIRKIRGEQEVRNINGGHLFPFEQPEATMVLIREFLG